MNMKPMLAATIKDLGSLRFPLVASPKLDGIRALGFNNTLVSRKLLEIPNHSVRQALSHLQGYDGELIAGKSHGPGVYNRTMSAVMTEQGEPLVTFWIFDYYPLSYLEFVTRHSNITKKAIIKGNVIYRRLKHVAIQTVDELNNYEEACVSAGYEGIMLRDPQGLYKFGRSTLREGGLLKLKRFEDSEAIILEVLEQKRNDNEATINELGATKRSSHKANKTLKGTTGALRVRDINTGVEFQIGTGLNDTVREQFWKDPPLGETVKYKFQPAGGKDKPRFPVFLGLRKD